MTDQFDAVVIGGGPGGSTAALLLARAGWSVALVERKAFPRRKVCGEYLSATNWPLLEQLGVARDFEDMAGPEVHRVALFAGATMTSAGLPHALGRTPRWGRALAREHLDTQLLHRAAQAGVDVRQPCSVTALTREGDGYCCQLKSEGTEENHWLKAGVVIAAHGSWESGPLPTQTARRPPEAADLFGFKAHFRQGDLPIGWMPLLAFPGGYGGMVHCDGGRVSLSCCIRRDALARIRVAPKGEAGEAVLEHIRASCVGVRRALTAAVRDGAWLAAGPIRPGMRLKGPPGIFRVGNAAGEAHPVVAEGISMAMQSAWLLSKRLIESHDGGNLSSSTLQNVAHDYAAAWRRNFAPRLYVSSVVAQWAIRPTAVASLLPLLQRFPMLLGWGARCSGKATRLVTAF